MINYIEKHLKVLQHSNHSICVLGSANSDLFLKVNNFPQEGQTLQANESYIQNGGKGSNQAVSVGKLAGSAIFAGQVGNDSLAQILVDEMNVSGVDLTFLRRVPGVQTGQAIIMLNQEGENCIIIIGGANMFYQSLSVLPEEYINAIHKSTLLMLQKEIPDQINILAAKYAKDNKKMVMLDCGGRDEPITDELIKNLDFISPNSTELARIMPVQQPIDPKDVREHLISKFPELKVLLKLGSQGSAIITQDLYHETQSVTLYNDQILKDFQIVDTTGAGDCYTGAFCVKYVELLKIWEQTPENYHKCMLFANSSAFLCITKLGAMPAMPERKNVDEFIENYLQGI